MKKKQKKISEQPYRDKYARTGRRAEEVPELRPYLIDLYEEFHGGQDVNVLCEGAQGFGLDIDWGDYPYVTSSHCTTAGAMLNGIPPNWIRDVWGVAKIYETYVGAKQFEPNEEIFQYIRDVGEEYGATTGRPRQCNWMDFNLIQKALKVNGVNKLVINKMDVLREVQKWKLIIDEQVLNLETETAMKGWIQSNLGEKVEIFFSEDKNRI